MEANTATPALAGPNLPLGQYRIRFSSSATASFVGFTGSAWRGALGYALRELACITGQPTCNGCALSRSCSYSWVFETPLPENSEKMRRYPQAPHPFIIEAPESTHKKTYTLGLNLVGHANRHLGVLAHALKKAAAGGVAGNTLQLETVEQIDSADLWQTIHTQGQALKALPIKPLAVPPTPTAVRLDLITPLRLRSGGKDVRPDCFEFAALFSNLLRRISMLTYFHTDTPLETDFSGLTKLAREIQASHQLSWQSQWRFSSRQKSKMDLAGLLGYIVLEGSDLQPFWPYLWIGQWVHAGHNATMGLGQYRLTSL